MRRKSGIKPYLSRPTLDNQPEALTAEGIPALIQEESQFGRFPQQVRPGFDQIPA
jgi:hypothetical protein